MYPAITDLSLQHQNFYKWHILVHSSQVHWLAHLYSLGKCVNFTFSPFNFPLTFWVTHVPKYSIFRVLSSIIQSHVPFLGLQIVQTLVIKPPAACFTALRRKCFITVSLEKTTKAYLFINEHAGCRKFQNVNYKTHCNCLQCTATINTFWYLINVANKFKRFHLIKTDK